MIGISASMKAELAFTENLPLIKAEKHACFEFSVYEYEGEKLAVAVCGTGKVSAAALAQTMILAYEPELIINIGTAGSVNADVKRKDVVVATDTVQHDYDASPFGYKKGELCELKRVELTCDEDFLKCAQDNRNQAYRVHFGRIVSGDIVVTDDEVKQKILTQFGGLCAEMEGAAFGQIAAMNGIGYAVIRGISDDEDSDRHESFRSSLGSVAQINGDFLLKVLKDYIRMKS